MSKNKTYQVACYLRLSREDGDKVMSDSISNQRAMIAEYVEQHKELNLVEEYSDDGYSGTNFDRPGFKQMLDDIKRKKINCVIVKDLSRLGRNYIETGRYLEKIFPMYQVRFISILDHYDNVNNEADVDQIIVPFKNLINDAYCRDISMKIRSHFEVKRKSGQFIGSFASYGYEKDPKNKNHLVIDVYAAEVVRFIFAKKLEGQSMEHIAEKLNDLGILNPSEYKRMSGLNFNAGYRCGPNPKWSAVSVRRILTNEMYTGTMVQGINEKINYRIKQSRVVPKEDWIRVPNTHEAIISHDVYERVQSLLELDTRTAPNQDSVYLFSGILVCADCGQNLVRRMVTRNNKKYAYYHCSTYKNNEGCTSHLISHIKLERAVLRAVKNQISLLIDAENIIKKIDHIPENHYGVKMLDAQIQVLLDNIERYRDLKTKLYMDKLDGVVDLNEYREINHKFSQKIDMYQNKCNEVQAEKDRFLSLKTNIPAWLEDFKQYKNITELNRKIVITLIDRIVIYSKNEIKIVFRYEDEIKTLFMLAEMEEEMHEDILEV